MNKKRLLISVIFILFIAIPLFAQDKHPIDASLDECLDKSKCVTAVMVDCLKKAHREWEVEMDKYYNLLMDILDDEPKEKLKKSQVAWMKYRDLEFEYIPTYYQDVGSYQGPTSWGHKLSIVKDRALQLQAYYATIMDGKIDE